MEANHPIFLPRLAPHLYNRRQSSRPRRMPSSRRRSAASSASSTSPSRASRMRTTPEDGAALDLRVFISTLSALADVNIHCACDSFTRFYRIDTHAAIQALSIMLLGDEEVRNSFRRLMKGLYEADPLLAVNIGLGLLMEARAEG